MRWTAGARGNAGVVALTALLWCATARPAAGPLRVSVAGKLVEAGATADRGTFVGDVLPVLDALGARTTYAAAQGKLSGQTSDGRPVEASVGEARLRVGGEVTECRAPFRDVGGRLTGPLAEVATALGCAVSVGKRGQELRLAHRLAQVEAYAACEGALIHLRMSGPTSGELRRLVNPPRAYVDFAAVTWTGRSEAIEVKGTGGLERVRWALFQEWPPIARVVVELAPGAEASMSEVEAGLYLITVRPPRPGTLAPATVRGAHVVLDPAGGGDEQGARGAETTEKAAALEVAARAALALMDAGVLVTLTRDRDVAVSMEDRAKLARGVDPTLVVRVQCAAEGRSPQRGIETRYAGGRSAGLAESLQSALIKGTRARNRGVVECRGEGLPGLEAPAATCVIGCLASPEDDRLLASAEYRTKLAEGIAEGITTYLTGHNGSGATPPRKEHRD